jgi:hypothetical protein
LGSDSSVAISVGRMGCTEVGGGRAECGMVPRASLWEVALRIPPPLLVGPGGVGSLMAVAAMEFAVDLKAACRA